mgnify:CR=1 FL=1
MIIAVCCPCCLAKERGERSNASNGAESGAASDEAEQLGGSFGSTAFTTTSGGTSSGAKHREQASTIHYNRTQRAQSSLHAFRKRAQTASAARFVFSSFDVTEARVHVVSAVMGRRRLSSMLKREDALGVGGGRGESMASRLSVELIAEDDRDMMEEEDDGENGVV